MAIDHTLRSQGIGASEISKVVGISKWGDAFSVYCSKLGLVPPAPQTEVQARGHRFERLVLEWWGEVIGKPTEWVDRTIQHPTRLWMLASPDGFSLDEAGRWEEGCDAKTVHYSNHDDWGEPNSDQIPEEYALQCAWSCAVFDKPTWSVAAMFSMDEMQSFRFHRDLEMEEILMEQGDSFWRHNVLARVPPRPTGSPAATDAIRRMFKRNTEPLRCATESEWPLIAALKAAKQEAARANRILAECKSQIQYAIGDAEGLLAGAEKITWRKEKDSVGPDWRAVANELGLRLELLKPIVEHVMLEANIAEEKGLVLASGATTAVAVKAVDWWSQTMSELAKAHEIITRHGARKLLTPRSWNSEDDE